MLVDYVIRWMVATKRRDRVAFKQEVKMKLTPLARDKAAQGG